MNSIRVLLPNITWLALLVFIGAIGATLFLDTADTRTIRKHKQQVRTLEKDIALYKYLPEDTAHIDTSATGTITASSLTIALRTFGKQYAIGPIDYQFTRIGAAMKNDHLRLMGHRMSLSFATFLDINMYAFIDAVQQSLPGLVTIETMTIEQTRPVEFSDDEDIAFGLKPPIFRTKVSFLLWNPVSNHQEDAFE